MLATVSFCKTAENLSRTPSVNCTLSCWKRAGVGVTVEVIVVAAAVSNEVNVAPASVALPAREIVQTVFIGIFLKIVNTLEKFQGAKYPCVGKKLERVDSLSVHAALRKIGRLHLGKLVLIDPVL